MSNSLTGVTGWLDRTFYPDYRSEEDLFREQIECHLEPSATVLDAGCGRGLVSYDYSDRSRFVVGCDLSRRVGENENLQSAARADLNELPFSDESFDLIISRYVMEHLTEPEHAFREMARTLRSDGYLVILTPNARHYVSLISRFTPHVFHNSVSRLRGTRSADDTFPTAYEANTRRRLMRLLRQASLEVTEYRAYETRPNYLVMTPFTYAVGILYERLVNRFGALSALRVSIIATARKA